MNGFRKWAYWIVAAFLLILVIDMDFSSHKQWAFRAGAIWEANAICITAIALLVIIPAIKKSN